VNYAVDGLFSPEKDSGMRWDSFGFNWPLPSGEISQKDLALPVFEEFDRAFGSELST
jgi:dTDP-4-dehydrorhamnose 3,5-epimerase